ncbi:apyrase, partial [Thalassiosira pseudonana CCMP1335]
FSPVHLLTQIDAGSTGSRMHVYEFEPRILANKNEVEMAVRGEKLSFPGMDSRWTERLRPGLSEFAELEDEEELEEFSSFPIFLKATAGLRTLSTPKRQRLISTVRKLFANDTYCPFWDEEERVRVISGEEEAVYGYAAVNFLLGNLMENSEGAGEAHGAVQTQGALDMGGASTQISFYQPQGDVMSGLFKLQVGQGKHWNIYAHSHLMFGMNMAEERRKALNNKAAGDWDQCKTLARDILNEGANAWCQFSHQGSCSFAGVYQPDLPTQEASFGEFYAFSNYFRVWQFLQLKPRSSLVELEARGREVCSKSWEELVKYNNANPDRAPDDEELESYCFRAAYVHSILSHGYGFQPDDHITATDVINGQKVTWALGSILY